MLERASSALTSSMQPGCAATSRRVSNSALGIWVTMAKASSVWATASLTAWASSAFLSLE